MRGMKFWPALLAFLACAIMPLAADVVMQMDMERTNFMQFEPVLVTLTMRNTAGQVLIFGTEPEFKGYMEIELTDLTGRPLPGSGARFELKGLMLRPGADQRIRVNLSSRVNLAKPGIYRVKLALGHPMLKDEYESNVQQFNVSTGKIFWTRRFGVPKIGETDSAGALQMRDYTLRGLQDGATLYYYLLVEDDDNIYAMKRIGMAMGREQPSCELDMLNRFHILLPLIPKIFQYQVFDWNGKRELNKIYKTTTSSPMLFRDTQSGEVKVIGGEEANPGVDYTEDKLLPDEMALPDGKSDSPVVSVETPASGKPETAGAANPADKPAPAPAAR